MSDLHLRYRQINRQSLTFFAAEGPKWQSLPDFNGSNAFRGVSFQLAHVAKASSLRTCLLFPVLGNVLPQEC